MLGKESPQSDEWVNGHCLALAFSGMGVETVMVDLDDTLIKTAELFWSAMRKVALLFSLASGRDGGEIYEMMGQAIRDLRKDYVVHPSIMEAAVCELARGLSLCSKMEEIEEAQKTVRGIYHKVPEVFPRVRGLLGGLRQATKRRGGELILATHAGEEWTERKLKGAGLDGRFDRVCCFDVNVPKSWQWSGVGVDLGKALVIEDNLKEGVLPVLEAGGWAVLVRNKNVFPRDEELLQRARKTERLMEVDETGGVADVLIKRVTFY